MILRGHVKEGCKDSIGLLVKDDIGLLVKDNLDLLVMNDTGHWLRMA